MRFEMNKLNIVIAMFCIVIIVNSSFAFAADTSSELFKGGEQDTGEAIIINVDQYQPTVVTSNVLEERSVPVYAYLKGMTLGSLLLGKDSPDASPFYGMPKIKSVTITAKGTDSYKYLQGGINYIKPPQRTFASDGNMVDLGYLIINLRQMKESEMPNVINLNLSARIRFDLEYGLSEFGSEEIFLKEYVNEEDWKRNKDGGEFWGGKGYVWASKIQDDRVSLRIYDSYLRGTLGSPVLSSSSPISSPMRTSGTSNYLDYFRVRLDGIDIPKDSADVLVDQGGTIEKYTVTEGGRLFPGSDWTVRSIKYNMQRPPEKGQTGDRIVDEVELEHRTGSIITINNVRKEPVKVVTAVDKTTAVQSARTNSICENSQLVTDDELVRMSGITSTRLYCTALNEFEDFLTSYPNSLHKDIIYEYMGDIYKQLGGEEYNSKAVEYYQKSQSPDAQRKFAILQKSINEGIETHWQVLDVPDQGGTIVNAGEEVQYDNEALRVMLLKANQITAEDRASAMISVGGGVSKQIILGEPITETYRGKDSKDFKWVVKEINSNNVVLGQDYLINVNGKTQTLTINKNYKLDAGVDDVGKDKQVDVIITKIDTKKIAKITILPGTGRDFAETEFGAHIPIDKRAIKLSPQMIDSQINKTDEIIKKMDRVIGKVDKLLTGWKVVCMSTFAILTVINLIKASYIGRAREYVMKKAKVTTTLENGKVITSTTGWSGICSSPDAVGFDKEWKSYDNCIFGNAGDINTQIEASTKVYKDVTGVLNGNEFKGYVKNWESGDASELIAKKLSISDAKDKEKIKILIQNGQLSPQEAENLFVLNGLSLKDADTKMVLDKSLDSIKEKGTIYQNVENSVKEVTKGWNVTPEQLEKMKGDERKNAIEIFKAGHNGQDVYTAYDTVKAEAWMNEVKNKGTVEGVNELGSINKGTGNTYVGFVKDEKTKKLVETPLSISKKDNQAEKDKDGRIIYIDEKTGNKYVSSSEMSGGGMIRNSYASDAIAQFYEDGKPYCIPTDETSLDGKGKGGNYIRVEYNRESIDKVSLWNVGSDGKMCEKGSDGLDDDILIMHSSEVDTNKKMRDSLITSVNRVNGACNPEKKLKNINFGGNKNMKCGFDATSAMGSISKLHCTDVMGITECKILFNVCDPVMCPASRFNFGGRWPIKSSRSVVETGIIGSLVLGLPNAIWNKGGSDIFPVCATGISAGLKSWRSVLQAYKECLHSSKINGETVGICDRIRSVYVCELIWREGMAILDTNKGIAGSVLDNIFGKRLGGEGGGEYSNPADFRNSLNGIANSAKFFTEDYAQSAFAAFKARSTEEVGTEICKAAIFGKAPGLGNLISDLAKPESPPQFTAFFDEFEWADPYKTTGSVGGTMGVGGEGQSRYSVYYHIYAGDDREARYSVFLTDSPIAGQYSAGQKRVFITDCNYGSTRGLISKGGYVDKNCDFLAASGMTQLCVEINGNFECGFGKVTSSFAMDYLKDQQVESEAGKNIQTEEQCVPSASKVAGTNSLILPGNYGMLSNTGIRRVCSDANPGRGTNEADWTAVGTCGKDKAGHELGQCWLDRRTIDITDLQTQADVNKVLGDKMKDYAPEYQEKVKYGLDKWTELKKLFDQWFVMPNGKIELVNKNIKGDDANFIKAVTSLLTGYDEIINLGVEVVDEKDEIKTNYAEESKYRRALIYSVLADWRKKWEEIKRINETPIVTAKPVASTVKTDIKTDINVVNSFGCSIEYAKSKLPPLLGVPRTISYQFNDATGKWQYGIYDSNYFEAVKKHPKTGSLNQWYNVDDKTLIEALNTLYIDMGRTDGIDEDGYKIHSELIGLLKSANLNDGLGILYAYARANAGYYENGKSITFKMARGRTDDHFFIRESGEKTELSHDTLNGLKSISEGKALISKTCTNIITKLSKGYEVLPNRNCVFVYRPDTIYSSEFVSDPISRTMSYKLFLIKYTYSNVNGWVASEERLIDPVEGYLRGEQCYISENKENDWLPVKDFLTNHITPNLNKGTDNKLKQYYALNRGIMLRLADLNKKDASGKLDPDGKAYLSDDNRKDGQMLLWNFVTSKAIDDKFSSTSPIGDSEVGKRTNDILYVCRDKNRPTNEYVAETMKGDFEYRDMEGLCVLKYITPVDAVTGASSAKTTLPVSRTASSTSKITPQTQGDYDRGTSVPVPDFVANPDKVVQVVPKPIVPTTLPVATCGNNMAEGIYVDGGEQCDGTDLGGKSCGDFGKSGTLKCRTDCKSFDTSGCKVSAQTTAPDTSSSASNTIPNPLSGKTFSVCIDAGHNGNDNSFTVDGKTYSEADTNLAIAKTLQGFLKFRGLNVFMSREGARRVMGAGDTLGDVCDNAYRVWFAEENKCDLRIAIHSDANAGGKGSFIICDGAKNPRYDGKGCSNTPSLPSKYKPVGSYNVVNPTAESEKLAVFISRRLSTKTWTTYRIGYNMGTEGIVKDTQTYGVSSLGYSAVGGLCQSSMPAVLIEVADHSNDAQKKLLIDYDFQSYVAEDIADGIDAYLGTLV